MRHLRICLLPFLLLLAGSTGRGAPALEASSASLAGILTFEVDHTGHRPTGWRGGPPDTLFADATIVHSGKYSGRIERTVESEGKFSSLTKGILVDFSGTRIELRGWMKTEGVTDAAGFWMREDGHGGQLEFTSLQNQQIRGTNDWTEYRISLPVNPAARKLFFGCMLSGLGKVWVDDFQLLVDGRPVWTVPKMTLAETALDIDHEFDSGSKIALTALSPGQVANLALLGRVWGYLKYYHPRVTAGAFHWDYELFRVAPKVLAAPDAATAGAAILTWIDGLGPLEFGGRQMPDSAAIALRPDFTWLNAPSLARTKLGARLRSIQETRFSRQFYVSIAPGVGNPVFENELPYSEIHFPDSGFQLLAWFRLWNIIEYWSPYRDLVNGDWDAVLAEFIPRVALAKDSAAYQLELIAAMTRIADTHTNLWSSLYVRPPVGDSQLPLVVRYVQGEFVVAQVLGSDSGFERGDVLIALDGVSVPHLVHEWLPYYVASNEPTRFRELAHNLTRGPAGVVAVRIKRGGEVLEVTGIRTKVDSAARADMSHELAGPAFRLLSPRVAYLKISAAKAADVAAYVQQATGTQGWIIDARGYPKDFLVFALGSQFVDHGTEFVRFTSGSLEMPGTFTFSPSLSVSPLPPPDPDTKLTAATEVIRDSPYVAKPDVIDWTPGKQPRYAGKIVILVDEVTQSAAEYTAMALRAAPRATVLGSTTAGADGNVSKFSLPGGLQSMISGIGIFYPDKRITQRVGIVPHLEVKPTIAGIREGRDELLEAAVRAIVGPEAPIAGFVPPRLTE